MQLNDLQLTQKRKKKKTIGRGGKKGTYSGKGNKGQKARSGAHVDPLFEGGRSTLVDHMKKKRGFTSYKPKRNVIQLEVLEKTFKSGDVISSETLMATKLIARKDLHLGVKILGKVKVTKKFVVTSEIYLSDSAKNAIISAGGEVKSGEKK
jgi:large subunit ribosomal protein L15